MEGFINNKFFVVKTIHTLKIRDYSLFEKTGNRRLLCRFPRFYKKQIARLLVEIVEGLGSKLGSDEVLNKEHHRLTSLYRIEQLVILYEGCRNLLTNKIIIDRKLKALGKKPRGNYDNLKIYIEKIEKATGIKIKVLEDLAKLKKQIDFWSVKYQENFKVKEQKGVITFDQIVMSVFMSAMKTTIDYSMPMSTFFELKAMVEESMKKKDG